MVPQVIITLAPDGGLQAEVPGLNGARRIIAMSDGEAGISIRRILEHQIKVINPKIGTDGSPTNAQVYHWEHHEDQGVFNDRCMFCIAESLGIDTSRKRAIPQPKPPWMTLGDGSVKVRRLPPRRSRSKGKKTTESRTFADLSALEQ
jgi:hypothetical protein